MSPLFGGKRKLFFQVLGIRVSPLSSRSAPEHLVCSKTMENHQRNIWGTLIEMSLEGSIFILNLKGGLTYATFVGGNVSM